MMMESQRGFLILALAIITFLLYQQWQIDHAPKPQVTKTEPATVAADNIGFDDSLQQEYQGDIPVANNPNEENQTVSRTQVVVNTDVLRVVIDTLGGDIIEADLLDYPETLNSTEPVKLFTRENGRVYEAQSGLVGKGAPDETRERVIYNVEQSEYALSSGQDELKVNLSWTSSDNARYIKTFTFNRGKYLVDVTYQIDNQSNSTLSNRLFAQLKRDRLQAESSEAVFGMQAYLGAAYSTQEKRYEKHEFEAMDETPLNVQTEGGWIAFLQHYFVTAWIPSQNQINTITSLVLPQNKVSIIRLFGDWVHVEPGSQQKVNAQLYIGPKIQEDLGNIADGLDLTVDYGILWWIGQPLFWLMDMFHKLIPNWGVAIILVTIAVKLLLFPLANAQYRSFARMRMLQPKLQQLKERYGEDRQKMSQAMMELYKKEKVNPLGGCLPLIVQMPVFFALYWVLLESVELRHADFMLWIKDLSVADPWFVLPVLMGASMYLMQKMQPTAPTMDPMQQKIMQMLPVIMTVFFVFAPAGLVLYWLVNNLLSISQQLFITKKFEQEHQNKSKNKSKK